jgi:hypothetical protein
VFLARILLGILQRGHASIVSPFAESCILEGGWVTDAPADKPELDHTLPVAPTEVAGFAQDVIAYLIEGERGNVADWSRWYDSETERRFFERHLLELLGPGAALVEAQRPLPSMLPEHVASRFHGQRVDFALETPDGVKIVFEVDGPTHRRSGSAQSSLDQERTRALHDSKWVVERIPADRVWMDDDLFSDVVKAQVERNSTLRHLREGTRDGNTPDVDTSLAFRCAIAPHALARIQLAILLAMLDGELSLAKPEWRIGVIERDLPVAEAAVVDIHSTVGPDGCVVRCSRLPGYPPDRCSRIPRQPERRVPAVVLDASRYPVP